MTERDESGRDAGEGLAQAGSERSVTAGVTSVSCRMSKELMSVSLPLRSLRAHSSFPLFPSMLSSLYIKATPGHHHP